LFFYTYSNDKPKLNKKTKAHAKTQRRKDYAKPALAPAAPQAREKQLFLQTQNDSVNTVFQNWNIEV